MSQIKYPAVTLEQIAQWLSDWVKTADYKNGTIGTTAEEYLAQQINAEIIRQYDEARRDYYSGLLPELLKAQEAVNRSLEANVTGVHIPTGTYTPEQVQRLIDADNKETTDGK